MNSIIFQHSQWIARAGVSVSQPKKAMARLVGEGLGEIASLLTFPIIKGIFPHTIASLQLLHPFDFSVLLDV